MHSTFVWCHAVGDAMLSTSYISSAENNRYLKLNNQIVDADDLEKELEGYRNEKEKYEMQMRQINDWIAYHIRCAYPDFLIPAPHAGQRFLILGDLQ